MEIGALQLRHFPRRNSQLTKGRFRYHGIEYLQCGQWEGGDTMLSPNGSRWMQTFRKLPTMAPNTKNTTHQKWEGTAAQLCESNIVVSMRDHLAIYVLFQCVAHSLDRRLLAGPQFEGFGGI